MALPCIYLCDYLPSGTAPENGSDNYAWGKIDDAGKYKIYTRASYCEGFVNGALSHESYFPIMKYSGVVPDGTIQNVDKRIYTTGTIDNESQYKKDRYIMNIQVIQLKLLL